MSSNFFPTQSGGARRPAASSLDRKRNRKTFDDLAGDESGEEEDMYAETAAFLGKNVDKDEESDGGSSDDGGLDGENDGEKEVDKAYKPRDRSKYFKDELSKQGIDLENEGEKVNSFISGKEQADYVPPSQEAMQKLFGWAAFDNMENFAMGKRETTDKSGRVLDINEGEEEDVKDAWFTQFKEEDESNKEKRVDLGRLSRKTAVKPTGPPIRVSDNPMMNCRILMQHMQPGETVMKCLRRLGQKAGPAGAAGTAQNRNRQKRQRTKPSKNAIEDKNSAGGVVELSDELKKQIEDRKRAFEEVTSAANTLLHQGQLETYDKTYEYYEQWINAQQEKLQKEMEAKRAAAAAAKAATQATAASQPPRSASSDSGVVKRQSGVLKWEYRWEGSDEVHGPFEHQQLTAWKGQGYFDNDEIDVFIRLAAGCGGADADHSWLPGDLIPSFAIEPKKKTTAAAKKKDTFKF